jgi:hypothetical protein
VEGALEAGSGGEDHGLTCGSIWVGETPLELWRSSDLSSTAFCCGD